jgi:hypothetical protein
MDARDLDRFAEYWMRTMNALTALQFRRASISLERARETPYPEADPPGRKEGSEHGNEEESTAQSARHSGDEQPRDGAQDGGGGGERGAEIDSAEIDGDGLGEEARHAAEERLD